MQNAGLVYVRQTNKNASILSPKYHGDAGYDVVCPKSILLIPHVVTKIPLGIELEMTDPSWVAFMMDRSSMASKGIVSVGSVIDASYRGEIHAVLLNATNTPIFLHKGDKIAQIVFTQYYNPVLEKKEVLEPSDRGSDGFGSTDKKEG